MPAGGERLSDDELARRTEELVSTAAHLSMELTLQTEKLAATLETLGREMRVKRRE